MTASQWSWAALALGAIATILFLADQLAQIRAIQRYARRVKAELPVHVPLRVDLHQRFDLGDEPTDLGERLRMRDERLDRIELRVDREVGDVREYVRDNVERLVQAEAEHRLRAIDASDSIVRSITLDGRWLRTASGVSLLLAVVCNAVALLVTPSTPPSSVQPNVVRGSGGPAAVYSSGPTPPHSSPGP